MQKKVCIGKETLALADVHICVSTLSVTADLITAVPLAPLNVIESFSFVVYFARMPGRFDDHGSNVSSRAARLTGA